MDSIKLQGTKSPYKKSAMFLCSSSDNELYEREFKKAISCGGLPKGVRGLSPTRDALAQTSSVEESPQHLVVKIAGIPPR